jgi:hypothetical protein
MENGTLTISLTQAWLVLAALASCIACIWMVFFFGRRIQTSAYLRESLVSAMKAEQFSWSDARPPSLARPLFGDSKEQQERLERHQLEEERRRAPFVKWVDEEKKRYANERQKLEKLAETRAEKMVPTSIDISLLGGGCRSCWSSAPSLLSSLFCFPWVYLAPLAGRTYRQF